MCTTNCVSYHWNRQIQRLENMRKVIPSQGHEYVWHNAHNHFISSWTRHDFTIKTKQITSLRHFISYVIVNNAQVLGACVINITRWREVVGSVRITQRPYEKRSYKVTRDNIVLMTEHVCYQVTSLLRAHKGYMWSAVWGWRMLYILIIVIIGLWWDTVSTSKHNACSRM